MNQNRRFVLLYVEFTVIARDGAEKSTGAPRAEPQRRCAWSTDFPLDRLATAGSRASDPHVLTPRRPDDRRRSTSRNRIAGQSAGFSRSDDGLTHVRANQRVDGLVVYGSYVKAAINDQGQVVHLIENLAPVPAHITRAVIDEEQALRAALGRVHPGVSAPRQARTQDGTVAFTSDSGSGYFHVAPQVERVLVSMQDGSLREGFLVETWTRQKNLLNHTLVSGEGEVLNVELRTNNDQYFVYVEDPGKGAQTLVSGPAPVTPVGTVPSPNGWLNTGTHKTINITGNNVHAYLDASPNNQPATAARTPPTDSSPPYTAPRPRRARPATAPVAVQNLFYLNNRIHDTLTWPAQRVRSQLPGEQLQPRRRRSDSVNAEAQDGGAPTTQLATRARAETRAAMYLLRQAAHQIGSRVDLRRGWRGFGPVLTTHGQDGIITVASPADGCTAISTTPTGRIAVIDRGPVRSRQVKNAQLRAPSAYLATTPATA